MEQTAQRTYSISPQGQPSTTKIEGWNTYAALGDFNVTFAEIQKKWNLKDIKRYIINLNSKEKAKATVKRMTGIWMQMALIEITPPTVYESNGNIAWALYDKEHSMLSYLDNFVDMFYEALALQQEGKRELDYLEGKTVVAEQKQYNNQYEEIVMQVVGNCMKVFEQYDLRNKLPLLRKLSDTGYMKFCAQVVTQRIDYVVALLHYVHLHEYTAYYIQGNKYCTHKAIFESNAEMYNMICDATQKGNVSQIKGNFGAIMTPSNSPLIIRNKANDYLDDAKKFFDSLV